MRSKFLEGGKVLSLFYAIIKQFDVLSESHDIDVTVGYKNIFNLCLNVSIVYFKLILDSKLIEMLSNKLQLIQLLKCSFILCEKSHQVLKFNFRPNSSWFIFQLSSRVSTNYL